MEVGTIESLKHYVARGLGIAVVAGLCVTEGDRTRLDIVPIPAELGGEATYGVVMRHDNHRGRLLDDLLRLLGTDHSAGGIDPAPPPSFVHSAQ